MSKKIPNAPSPKVLMNSLRSLGYTIETALADIVDNSISADANEIFIHFPTCKDDLFISVLDNGEGMSNKELLNAMKYGSEREYSSHDLGRFGIGMKSASLSQCRVLTVASKQNNTISAFRWDLDDINKEKEWMCIELDNEEIKDIPGYDELADLKMGTLVVWQKFDIAEKKIETKNKEEIIDYLMKESERVENHLSLVFHRFLSRKINQIKIYINKNEIEPLNPFLENHPKTESKKIDEISLGTSTIKVQPYILPHNEDLSAEDINKLGGIASLRNNQGFYIYRNDRLINYGNWFRLSSSDVNKELLKYGRIKVDIPNDMDDVWEIDVRKQEAKIPPRIIKYLKKKVSEVCRDSKNKTTKRVNLNLEQDNNKIWNKTLTKDQKEAYFINKECLFVRNFLDDFEDKDKKKILNFVDIISSKLPFDDIYNSVCNQKHSSIASSEQIDSIIIEGIFQFKTLKELKKKTNKEILDLMSSYEPFNDPEILTKISERIENE